jgi:phosphoserine phosphatase RsbU/P
MENEPKRTSILVAEDDPVSRRLLAAILDKWGYHALLTANGFEAWEVLTGSDSPGLALLDWMMPGIDGLELCRRVRSTEGTRAKYVILLTARSERGDAVEGLEAGADDFVTKPFNKNELRARLQVGLRVLQLQRRLADRVSELEDALKKVKLLQGLVPICSYCKKIRNDQNFWQQVESFISEHSEAQFSHGICPDCLEKLVMPEVASMACKGEIK